MDLQKQLEEIFSSDEYKKVTEAIKKEFILSNKLMDENGLPREKDWTPVQEPVMVNGKAWKVFVFRFATTTEVLKSPVYLTFARIAPPDIIKQPLDVLSEGDATWKRAVEDYSAAIMSPDMERVKAELMQLFETTIYPNKNFHFTPDPQAYGLLPHFDFDFVIPFISLPSLIANRAV
jgi:hypothetical protein